MRVIIEFQCEGPGFMDNFEDELGFVLDQARKKVLEQRDRPPATVCKAPESADILKNRVGNTVGSVELVVTHLLTTDCTQTACGMWLHQTHGLNSDADINFVTCPACSRIHREYEEAQCHK